MNKHLEKVYLKLFENNKLTDEGKQICKDLYINPDDLKVRTRDDFLDEVGGIADVA
jgi:hypothetical protein